MAKVNLWLRGARGKFAGASLAKGSDGETIAREVVSPSNPNTEKQRYQRAIMATVMIMYSAFSELFDHSFEGKKKGSECQQEFIKRNAHILRSALSVDLARYEATDSSHIDFSYLRNTVVLPKSDWPAANAYQISAGSYNQNFFKTNRKRIIDNEQYQPDAKATAICYEIPTPLLGETVAAYAKRNGLVAGDIYTVVALACDYYNTMRNEYVAVAGRTPANIAPVRGSYTQQTTYDNGAISQRMYPVWFRMQVKSGLETINDAADTTFSTYFDLTELSDPNGLLPDFSTLGNGSFVGTYDVYNAAEEGENPYYELDGDPIPVACVGVIRSRYDEDLRSTSFMTLSNDLGYEGTPTEGHALDSMVISGITAPCIPNSWNMSAEELGKSEYILESNINGGFTPA